jgi:hypothetical protein
MLVGTAAAFVTVGGAAAQTGPRGAQPDLAGGVHAATPIPAPPSLGQGKDRALVLGGGGEYFIAWLLGLRTGSTPRAFPMTSPMSSSAPRPAR